MIDENEFEATKIPRVTGDAEATQAEKDDVGGEKTWTITNHLFQEDAKAQEIAKKLLQRMKDRKQYFVATAEFCPVPVELGDTIQGQERITNFDRSANPYGDPSRKYGDSSFPYRSNGIVLGHCGIVRDIKLVVTPESQSLAFTLEE